MATEQAAGKAPAGVRNMPIVRTVPSAFAVSRITRLAMDRTKPKPRAKSMTGINTKGTKTTPHEGVTPYQVKTATTGTSRTKKSKTAVLGLL